ncbi:bromodomain-containing protein [Gossypium australe]|uniref:Bromodomain-containing protein n=1 Tax=Gossypium australe TaxID=47621 RepID=A0A5B6X2X3_9ROSI|nr:bromodomain-containing protein [Gossypium australe]
MLQNRLPQKLKDPGSFTIPCLIGSLTIDNALADLGASINVMPYKLLKQLGLEKTKQTRMSIQLADKTIRVPRGIIEEVLVKIDKFVFPIDFVVLDMDEDNSIPLILGRPFLATARTKIDVDAGELILCSRFKLSTHVRTLNDQCENINYINNHLVNPPFQEKPEKETTESDPKTRANKEIIHEEQGIQTDELAKGTTHLKKELGIYEGESKPLHEAKRFKIEVQVLLNKTDPRISPPDPNTCKEIPFQVIDVFPYGTVEISRRHGRGRGCVVVQNLRTDNGRDGTNQTT